MKNQQPLHQLQVRTHLLAGKKFKTAQEREEFLAKHKKLVQDAGYDFRLPPGQFKQFHAQTTALE